MVRLFTEIVRSASAEDPALLAPKFRNEGGIYSRQPSFRFD